MPTATRSARPASDPKVRLAWVKYRLAKHGSSLLAVATASGTSIAYVSRLVAGSRGEKESELARAVWRTAARLARTTIEELQRPA